MTPTSRPSLQQTTVDPGLEALFARLENQSLIPDFQLQRELGLSFALRPYLTPNQPLQLEPLPEEVELATLYLYSDYFPTDGHPTLIEQVRDLITQHVPQEERDWLDAVRHAYMDLLEVVDFDTQSQTSNLSLRSLGDGQEFRMTEHILTRTIQKGQILLTRLIRRSEYVSLPGVALILSETMGKTVFNFANDERRAIEVGSGELALGEWPEFAKRYGHLLLWSVAKVRGGATLVADSRVEYRDTKGRPYFYAIAIYEHREPKLLEEGLSQIDGLQKEETTGSSPRETHDEWPRVWLQCPLDSGPEKLTRSQARITLTPIQLFVEARTWEDLDALKHELARTFGFSLHFRGEISTPPAHIVPQVDLLSDSFIAPPVIVSIEEEQKMLNALLESTLLEWAERPSPSLNDETPRHAALKNDDTGRVAKLIDQLEQHDLAYCRTGTRGYDYNILRGHVGI